ncbi:rod shape-determining protein RodA [Patescibacteria group bacterium]|nr:rod shape-determining protein RodA [Patescibacteria group bacterium]
MTRRNIWGLEWGLFIPAAILVLISLITLSTINADLFRSQLIFFILSIAVFLLISQVNYKIFQYYSLPIYILSIILLSVVLILGIESRGSVRWIEFAGFRIQFSEIFKPFLALSLSAFLASHKNYSFKNLLISMGYVLPVAFLIFKQPDLGNALIYVLVALFTFIFFGFPLRYFIAAAIPVGLLIPMFWQFLHDYQRQRVLTFFNPSQDPLGTSYNAIQSIITVGSGMLLGKGLGQGSQSGLSFLPERHTDFIFASISEALGFAGDAVILVCFLIIFYKIFQIFENTDDRFCKIFAGTAFFLILIQFFVNIGMNIGLLPIVGVTLPFVSYGGSSLLSNFILLGLLVAINRKTKEEKVLEIR